MDLVKIYPDKVAIKTSNQQLSDITINSAMKISDSKSGVALVCVVTSVFKNEDREQFDFDGELLETDQTSTIECGIIGSISSGRFEKSVDRYPTSNVKIERLRNSEFVNMLLESSPSSFRIGEYSGYNCEASLDGNRFFQRHSAIVGSTGSGKSYTEASLLEKLSKKKSANVVLFDLHGEYSSLSYVKKIKIGDLDLSFPIWFLPLKDICSNVLRIKEESAQQQMAAFRRAFYFARKSNASEDTPIKFDFQDIISFLEKENSEETPTGEVYKTGQRAGEPKTVKGENNGKLTGSISLIKDKERDSRYRFMTKQQPQEYLYFFLRELMSIEEKNIKVLDLSDIPSDMVPTVIAVTTKLLYRAQLQQDRRSIIPLNIICDEAHVYIPSDDFGLGASQRRMLEIFETIAKEGRKFGVSLTIISQRPSELNKTILAQCANFIVLKLSNDADKQIIKGLLPESGKEIVDNTSLFRPGDCIVVGDSAKITFKIKIDPPREAPNSRTIQTWDEWGKEKSLDTDLLVDSILRQGG